MKKNIQHFISFIFLLLILISNSNAQNLLNNTGVFNGTASYLSAPSTSSISPTTAITIEAWIYPTSFAHVSSIVAKNYTTSYDLGINTAGNLGFYPKGGSYFLSTTVLPLNQWTHVAATYDGTKAKIYINGVCNDSTSAITGAITTNTDSLFIGCDRDGATKNYFFTGKIDNVRIWNVARSADDIANNRFINLGMSSAGGKYTGMAASYNFDLYSSITSIYDWCVLNNAANHNVTLENDSNMPVPYQDFNNCLALDGNSYCRSANYSSYNATTAITLEAWVRIDTVGGIPNPQEIIVKCGPSRCDYDLGVNHNTGNVVTPFFGINTEARLLYNASITFPVNRWTHLAATYNSATGLAKIYVNGDSVMSSTFTGSPLINNNTDTLEIGEVNNSLWGLDGFKGQIDEVRIWKNIARTTAQIKADMYNTFQINIPDSCATFNFDQLSSWLNLTSFRIGLLHFVNNAFISSSHNQNLNYTTAPILFDPGSTFTSTNYLISTKRLAPPVTTDSIYVSTAGTISDIKVFALYNTLHANLSTITLKSPNGTTVQVTPTTATLGNNLNDMITVFDQTATNTAAWSGTILPPFSPIIKPANTLATFNGLQAQGWWKIILGGTGYISANYSQLSGWGIKPTIVTAVNDAAKVPTKFELSQNYPNPFNPTTTINYQLPKASKIILKIYDVLGKEVTTLVNNEQQAGAYSVNFNASNLASGIYFYKIEAGNYIETKKMILMK